MRADAFILLASSFALAQSSESAFTSLTEKQARQTISAMRANGQVGGSFDFRVTSTDRSYNYKLRATWITPPVANAAARLLMLAKGHSESQAREALQTVRSDSSYFVLVELDPREGSGVIPKDWTSRFGPREVESRQGAGEIVPAEGVWKSLISVFPRDYAYDVFLLKFPSTATDGTELLQPGDAQVELIVRIYNKVGRVKWAVPSGAQK